MMKSKRDDIKLEKVYKEFKKDLNETLEYIKGEATGNDIDYLDTLNFEMEQDRMVLKYLAYGKLMEMILDRSNKIFSEAIEISRRQDSDAMGNFFLINNMFPEDIIREMIKRCGVVMGCESKEVDLTQWIELISSTNQ